PDEARPPLVFAAMRDKEIAGMFQALLPTVGTLIVTRASTARAAAPDELATIARGVAPQVSVLVIPSPREALDAAWRLAPRIVVAGSIFLLGDVLKAIDAA